ncbi:MAG: VOC family protein [Synergistaceae bacterium]|jgi:catechol 2,3-dioxygenase-like lactoylglutathione lyase family enzyme|nr:VOC family protein [Synergistaceae bacterium]
MNRINIICLGVRDMKKSRSFYRDALGLVTSNDEDDPKVIFFNNRGTKLELCQFDLLALDIDEKNPPKIGGGFQGITLAYNAKSKEEVDAIFARIESLGGKIAKRPQTVFWGGYSGYFQDLDGYYWEVAYADIWKFDENDMLIIE